MKRFFSADCHFGGGGISKHAGRPFSSPEQMNDRLIHSFNMRVKPEDTVYHVGDFCCFGNDQGNVGLRIKPSEYLKKLNGKWIIVEGNHDRNNRVKIDAAFLFLNIGKYRVFVTHYPTDSSENLALGRSFWGNIVEFAVRNTEFAICGHQHTEFKYKFCRQFGRKYLNYNVGVDQHKFCPISSAELISDVDAIFRSENICT